MTRKELLSIPFVLGVGIMVLAVLTAIVFAKPFCNGHKPAEERSEYDGCWISGYAGCNSVLPDDCNNSTKPSRTNTSGNTRYFSTAAGTVAHDRAIIGGTVLCGYHRVCYLIGPSFCTSGDYARDSNGNLIEYRKSYWISEECNPPPEWP